jgi:hypothetical protein
MHIEPLVQAFAALAILGGVWWRSRLRARRRWQAALDTFAKLQVTRETPRRAAQKG